MTTLYLVAGLLMGAIALTALLGMRKMCGNLTRQSLPLYVAQLLSWLFFGILFFSGVILFMFLATLSIIFIPQIIWILRLQKDDPAT